MRRKVCENCYRKKTKTPNNQGSVEFGLITVLQVLEGAVTVYKLKDEWETYKKEHSVEDMNLYQLRKAYKNGELDSKGEELASEIFRERVECEDCQQQKTLDQFSGL